MTNVAFINDAPRTTISKPPMNDATEPPKLRRPAPSGIEVISRCAHERATMVRIASADTVIAVPINMAKTAMTPVCGSPNER